MQDKEVNKLYDDFCRLHEQIKHDLNTIKPSPRTSCYFRAWSVLSEPDFEQNKKQYSEYVQQFNSWIVRLQARNSACSENKLSLNSVEAKNKLGFCNIFQSNISKRLRDLGNALGISESAQSNADVESEYRKMLLKVGGS